MPLSSQEDPKHVGTLEISGRSHRKGLVLRNHILDNCSLHGAYKATTEPSGVFLGVNWMPSEDDQLPEVRRALI